MPWRIYYRRAVVEGETAEEWRAAPDDGVQVVVAPAPGPAMGWSYVDAHGNNTPVRDRQLWTGDDEYDPFGWGVKRCTRKIPDAEYWTIWRRACSDPIGALCRS